MPLPAIVLGAARVGAAVYSHFFPAVIATAVVNKATDNKLAELAVKAGDATIGPDNMRALGRGIKDGVGYVGEGLTGAAKTVDQHYKNEAPTIIPLGKQGIQGAELVGVALLAEQQSLLGKGISCRAGPLKESFDFSAEGSAASTPAASAPSGSASKPAPAAPLTK